MDEFFKTVNKFYKTILKAALGVLGVIVTIGAGYGLSAVRSLAQLGGGGGWYTFLLVIYWIAVIAVILCGVFKVAERLMKSNGQNMSNNAYNSNVNNTYSQPNFNQQQAGNFNSQTQRQTVPAGDTFCPVCGGKIPSGNQFCPNCGNKI